MHHGKKICLFVLCIIELALIANYKLESFGQKLDIVLSVTFKFIKNAYGAYNYACFGIHLSLFSYLKLIKPCSSHAIAKVHSLSFVADCIFCANFYDVIMMFIHQK